MRNPFWFSENKVFDASETFYLKESIIFPNGLDSDIIGSLTEIKTKLTSLTIIEFVGYDWIDEFGWDWWQKSAECFGNHYIFN